MFTPMITIGRRALVLAAAAFALGACGGNGNAAVSAEDMVLGQTNAPVTVIEYASTTCSHCAHFHETVWEQFKANYIDTGKVRFVFREFPTAPAPVAVAGFQVARCGGANSEQYFERVGELFRTQPALFQSLQVDGGRQFFIDFGASANLTQEQTLACISDVSGAERIRKTVEEGSAQFTITGTPTFILDGVKVTDPSVVTYEGLSRLVDAALAN
jgi:protein-disulfide isomerase